MRLPVPSVLRTVATLSPAEAALVMLAWAMIGTSSLLIKLAPFARLAPLLGRQVGATAVVPLTDARQAARAALVARAIARASRWAPFRSDCLPQAMTGSVLCRWLGVPYAMHLGVLLNDPETGKKMVAHAWLEAGRVRVTGGHGVFRYTPVACFLRGAR